MPPLRARVNDLAGVLSPERAAALDARLARYEQETSHQIVVLTIPTLDHEPIEQFSMRVVEAWKIGQKKLDNGILLLVVTKDHEARIEVGYGLEGVVPDAIANRILDEVIFPRFRAGKMADGIDAGVTALMAAARGEQIPASAQPRFRGPARGNPFPLSEVLFAAFAASFIGIPFRRGRRRWIGVLLGGLAAGALTWLLVRGLVWAGLAAGLGGFLGWTGPGAGAGGRRSIYGGPLWWGGGFGGGGGGGGFGGGFSGGGGSFGGGGASGSW